MEKTLANGCINCEFAKLVNLQHTPSSKGDIAPLRIAVAAPISIGSPKGVPVPCISRTLMSYTFAIIIMGCLQCVKNVMIIFHLSIVD